MRRVLFPAALAVSTFAATGWGQEAGPVADEREVVETRREVQVALARGQKVAPQPQDPPEKMGDRRTFEELKAEVRKALQGKKPDERAEAVAGYVPRLVQLAEEAEGKDKSRRIGYLMSMALATRHPDLHKAATALIRGRAKTAAAADDLAVLAQAPDEECMALLKEVVEGNPDKKVQAKAALALVKMNTYLGQMAEQVKDEKVRDRYRDGMGEEFVKRLQADAKEFPKRAAEYEKLLATTFKGVLVRPVIGQPAPSAVCKDLDGKEVKLTDYAGKVVVLDFWATWCGHCVDMIPHERELVERLKDKPFALISVSADDSAAVVQKFLKKTDMPWVHWHNGPEGQLIEDWEVEGYPTIHVIDHKGVVRFTGVRGKKMDEAVDQLLAEREKSQGK